MSGERFETRAKVLKVDESLGLVFGWGVICSEDGEDYFDTQGDHIPEAAMLAATAEFMQKSQVSGDMHEAADGQVVFAFPLTSDVAEAFGIRCSKRGLMIAVRPSTTVLDKFKSGEYTGFSIGGRRQLEEVVES